MIPGLSTFSLFLTTLLASLIIFSAKSNLNRKLSECLKSTTDVNRNRKDTIKHLLSLNSKAKILRIKRSIAEKAYRAAPTPASRAAAFTALKGVKALQRAFRLYQQTVLTKLKGHSLSFKNQALAKRTSILKFSDKTLVLAYPRKSDSPSYKTVQELTNRSKVLVKKHVNLVQSLPAFTSNLISNKKGFVECGSAIKISKDNQMYIGLLGGRSF